MYLLALSAFEYQNRSLFSALEHIIEATGDRQEKDRTILSSVK